MKPSITHHARRIAYLESGFATGVAPLVLLHGLCEDTGIWEPLMPYLTDMSILRVDLPGFGESDLPDQPGMETYADAVHALLEEKGVEKAVLIGHSMGGYAALAFAEKYPARLAGFGLFHAHPFADSPERADGRRRAIELLQEGKRDLYVSQLFPGLFATAFAEKNPDLVKHLIDTQGKMQSAEGITAALAGMVARPDRTEVLRRFPNPVLWLLGALDAIVPVEATLGAAALCSMAVVELLPEVGHMGMYESPERCAAIVHHFYNTCTL